MYFFLNFIRTVKLSRVERFDYSRRVLLSLRYDCCQMISYHLSLEFSLKLGKN